MTGTRCPPFRATWIRHNSPLSVVGVWYGIHRFLMLLFLWYEVRHNALRKTDYMSNVNKPRLLEMRTVCAVQAPRGGCAQCCPLPKMVPPRGGNAFLNALHLGNLPILVHKRGFHGSVQNTPQLAFCLQDDTHFPLYWFTRVQRPRHALTKAAANNGSSSITIPSVAPSSGNERARHFRVTLCRRIFGKGAWRYAQYSYSYV